MTVPNVVNRTQDEAVARLTGLGFKTNPVSLPNDSVAPGIVYAQDPAAGKKIKKGSTISLSVSSGPIETTTTTSTTVAPTTVVTQRRTTTTKRQVTTTRPPTTTAKPTTTTAKVTTTTVASTTSSI